jgi:hypothetical protein
MAMSNKVVVNTSNAQKANTLPKIFLIKFMLVFIMPN